MPEMKLQDLKSKSPTELLTFAEEQEVENANTLRKQELMFAILKKLADNEVGIWVVVRPNNDCVIRIARSCSLPRRRSKR